MRASVIVCTYSMDLQVKYNSLNYSLINLKLIGVV